MISKPKNTKNISDSYNGENNNLINNYKGNDTKIDFIRDLKMDNQ